MIVLVLMGLGAFAIVNIVRVAYKSFDKTDERYEKQEAVKTVAELLQKGTKISASDLAAVYNDINVVPSGNTIDNTYSYLYAEPHYKEDEDGNATEEMDGYFVKILNAGALRENAIVISPEPMFISIDVIQETVTGYKMDGDGSIDYDSPTTYVEDQCGVKVRLMAVDDDYYKREKDDDDPSDMVPLSDEVFYELDVSYHFPNMATRDNLSVNHINKQPMHIYENNAIKYPVVDENGFVLKVDIDKIIQGDEATIDATLPTFCFIATASYGADSGEVGLLCDFRDNCLLTNAPGRLFVKTYYAISPPIADFIAQHETLRAAVRTMLKPLVVVAEYSLNHELISEVAPSLIVAFALGLPLSATAVVINKKRKRGED